MAKIKLPAVNWDFVVRWAGRWILPVFFYGVGLGFLFPMVRDNMKVGWISQEGLDTTTSSEEIVYDSTTCQTIVQPDGTIVDTCQDVAWTQDINIFEVDGYGFSEFLLPIRLIVGLVVLAIAYKLTPK